jgi:hypothetical protein
MNYDEHDDPVWKLLGRAGRTSIRPDFAENVLKALSQHAQEAETSRGEGAASAPANLLAFPQRRPRRFVWIAAAAAAIAVLAAVGLSLVNRPPSGSGGHPTQPEIAAQNDSPAASPAAGVESAPVIEDTAEQELVAVDGVTSLIHVSEVSELSDAELIALLN